jgi:hypothetical protein
MMGVTLSLPGVQWYRRHGEQELANHSRLGPQRRPLQCPGGRFHFKQLFARDAKNLPFDISPPRPDRPESEDVKTPREAVASQEVHPFPFAALCYAGGIML